MGFDVVYEGRLQLDKPLDDETYNLLVGLNQTRRVKRDPEKLKELGFTGDYGRDGEYFIHPEGADHDASVINPSAPPSSQPWVWMPWIPSEDRLYIQWDRTEKSYCGYEWISYIVGRILRSRGYVANGTINVWDMQSGKYHITVNDNLVKGKRGYSKMQKVPDIHAWYKELQEDLRATINRLTNQ